MNRLLDCVASTGYETTVDLDDGDDHGPTLTAIHAFLLLGLHDSVSLNHKSGQTYTYSLHVVEETSVQIG